MINNSILVSHENEFSWVACAGKGSFQNSALLKGWCEKEINNGSSCVVVDLAECKAMDSTFMGTLAGLAMLLMKLPDGRLQIISPDEKNTKSLVDLGLESLLEINPDKAIWEIHIDAVRGRLQLCVSDTDVFDQGENVLEAHKKLCEADARNNEKFASVLDILEAELEAKKNKA